MKEGLENFFFYSPKLLNFGDTLNEWLWTSIKKDHKKTIRGKNVLGMGSIFVDRFFLENNLQNSEILVLGSGAKSVQSIPACQLHEGSFFRGPLTSDLIPGTHASFITDSAYFLRQTSFYKSKLLQVTKEYEISIMPYFRSMDLVDWAKVGEKLGVHIIDSRVPHGVEFALEEIAKSKILIGEAMHGAILADALRVPWVRLEFLSKIFESNSISEFKWKDWCLSIDIQEYSLIKTNVWDFIASKTPFQWKSKLLKLRRKSFQNKLLDAVNGFVKGERICSLSENHTIEQIDKKLAEVINNLFEEDHDIN